MSLTVLPQADRVSDLVTRAREAGAVAMTDLTAALEGSDLPADAVDGVVQLLADEGVEVLDVADEAEDRRDGRAEIARRAATGGLFQKVVHSTETGMMRVPALGTLEADLQAGRARMYRLPAFSRPGRYARGILTEGRIAKRTAGRGGRSAGTRALP